LRHLLSESDLATHDASWETYNQQVARAEEAQHNLDAARLAQRQLEQYAEYDIERIEMLVADDACPACALDRGRAHRLVDAPALPVHGCSNGICRCDYSPLVFAEDGRLR
jgi:hypothetical protein